MTTRKGKEPDIVVKSATELGLAVYENVGRVLLSGPIANAVHYGSVSLFYIEIGTVLLFICLFMAMYYPQIMLPFALICAGWVGICFLPLIFLHFIHIPLKLLLKLKANYRKVSFKSGRYELLIELKSKSVKRQKRGEWFKRFIKIKQEKAILQEQGNLQNEQDVLEHNRMVFSKMMFRGKARDLEQDSAYPHEDNLQEGESQSQVDNLHESYLHKANQHEANLKKANLPENNLQEQASSDSPQESTQKASQETMITSESASAEHTKKPLRIRIRGRERKD